MSDAFGRKTGQMILVFPYTIGWVVMGLAKNNAVMMLGRFITGICTGAVRPLGLVYIGEVSDPKYRAITLVCPALATFVGSTLSHIVGNLYWRWSCFLFGLPNVLCFVMLLFLKESPIWLLSKGKIDDGVYSFKFFRGPGDTAETELKLVLEKQKHNDNKSSIKDNFSLIFSKAFFKSLLCIFLLFLAVQLCGINTIMFYSQDIFKTTFKGDVDEYMLMIVTDVLRVITTAVMCLIANHVRKKLTFLISCYATTSILIVFIVYLYLKPEGMLWIAITCLVIYIVIASALTSLSMPFVAEIFPTRVRGLGSGISSLITFALLFVSVKITPSIIENFGDIAMYASFAFVTFISAIFLTFILPNTDGRSLQDIENSLFGEDENETKQIEQTRL